LAGGLAIGWSGAVDIQVINRDPFFIWYRKED
jgi:hypothetical protein